MTIERKGGLVAALVMLLLCLAALPGPAHAETDWTKRVARTEIGGHLMGNPAAPRKIVEYASYSCPHCAHFEEEGAPLLKANYVKTGKASVEVRPFTRNIFDLSAGLVAQCAAPARFFGLHAALMAAQDQWIAKAAAPTAAMQKRWNEGALPERLKAIAADLGFYAIAAKHGVSRSAAEACLADESARATLVALTQYGANNAKIEGTPGFTLDGKLLKGVHGWAALKAALATP